MILSRRSATISGKSLGTTPPPNGPWSRVATVVSPTVAWEQTSIQEPNVLYDSVNGFRMWAKGGWAAPALGYYTSSDGLTWTAFAGNPILGQGVAGIAGDVQQPSIFQDGSTLICYFNANSNGTSNTPRYATSTNGTTWTLGGSGNYITNPGAIVQWGNSHVWKVGADWKMLQEARIAGLWQILYATSADGHAWTIGNGGAALTSLALAPVGSCHFGGPAMYAASPSWGGLYHLWYHAGFGDRSDIYHATSADAITWTINGPVLSHRGAGDEIDQAADPTVITKGERANLFFAGVDNTGQTGRILLTAAGAL